MNSSNNKWYWIVGVVIIVVIIVLAQGGGNSKDNKSEPIKIGFIGPLTGDGASYGIPFKNAVTMATAEINATGGINGRQIQMIYEDGKCGKDAATASQKLVNVDKVKIIIGGFCSGESLAALPVTSAAKVILFSPGSSNPILTGANKYFVRNYPSDALPGIRIAQLMVDRGIKNVAVVSETSDAAIGLRKVFIDEFGRLGGKVVADETFTTGTRDFRSNLTKIKNSSPQAMYVIGQSPATDELVIRQANEIGLKTQLFGGFEIFGSEDMLKDVPNLLEGSIYMEPSLDETAKQTADFISKYKSQYQSFGGLPSIYAATSYDAVYILKDMVEKYGMDTDKIADGLRQIKDWKGAEGVLTINQQGDPEFQYTVRVIHDGKVENLK